MEHSLTLLGVMEGFVMRDNVNKLIAFEDLENIIINNGFCTLCGACEAACPIHTIRIEDNRPYRLHDCSEHLDSCPICYDICPHSDALLYESLSFTADAPHRRESIGSYRRILLAQASDKSIREATRSGGVVNALLKFAMDKQIIDSAIISESSPTLSIKVRPSISLVPDDTLSAVETKIVPSAVARAFGRAVYEYGRAHIAFVGVPCHVLALRKLEAWQHRIIDSLEIIVGLFCLWTFSLNILLEYLLHEHGIAANEIQHVDLSSKEYIIYTKGGERRIPLSMVKKHILNRCKTCVDFTSKFADLSVGGASPLKDWSVVIIRTRRGEEIFNKAVKEGVITARRIEPEVLAHLIQLATYKRESALKEIRNLIKMGVPVPGAVKFSAKFVSGRINGLEEMSVREIMTKNVVFLRPELTVNEFFDRIAEYHHIGYPVIDGTNKIIGVITLQDAMKVPKEKRETTHIGEICSKKLITVFPDDSVAEALEKMNTHNIGRVLVVDRKNKDMLLGIITRSDIVHALARL